MTPNFRHDGSMFSGSIVALVTPFEAGGGVDYAALRGLVDYHLGQGTDGLVVAGTTGESPTLSAAELATMFAAVRDQVAGRIPVLAGTGSASTAAAVERTQAATAWGADGALVVTPYYNRPTQAGLEAHFTAVADAAGIPVVLYNVPSRTGVDLLPATVERLCGHERIVAIKEAVPDPARVDELRARCGPDFTLLSGDDSSCLVAMKHGAAGVVSVAANLAPGAMGRLCAAARRQDWVEAGRLDDMLQPLYSALALETNPIPVKWALFEMRRIGSRLRLPLTPLAEVHHAAVRDCLEQLDLLRA